MRARPTHLRGLVAQHRDGILALARKHNARDVRLFGSVARGDADESSDIDFLVTFSPDADVFARLDLAEDLSALLGVRVEVVQEAALHPVIRDDVLAEAVPV